MADPGRRCSLAILPRVSSTFPTFELKLREYWGLSWIGGCGERKGVEKRNALGFSDDVANFTFPFYRPTLLNRFHLVPTTPPYLSLSTGQPYNLPLLANFLNSPLKPRLIDYEQLTSPNGKRMVGFGFYAGSLGVVEALCAVGLDLLGVGIAGPFLVSLA